MRVNAEIRESAFSAHIKLLILVNKAGAGWRWLV
jgi:hypothetical protein